MTVLQTPPPTGAPTQPRSGSGRRRWSLFGVVNATVLLVIAALCVFPLIYVLAISLSDGRAVTAGSVIGWPRGFNLETYRYIFTDTRLGILRSLANSVLYTVVGTTFSVTITYLTAYALSKKRLVGARVVMLLFVFTWVFDAGIVPAYIVNSKLGMVDNWLVMIIPWGFTTFLLIVTRAFLQTIPDELEEAAFMDGANDLQIFGRVYLPLSKTIIATIAIFYAIQIWNMFLVPLIYLRDTSLAPIQLVLYRLVVSGDDQSAAFNQITMGGHVIAPASLQAATMVFAVIPILALFPFAQRFFAQGLLVGSVKG